MKHLEKIIAFWWDNKTYYSSVIDTEQGPVNCFWTVVLERTLESPLNGKEIKPVNPEGNQSWIFIGRTDAEAEVPILWSPVVKNWLIGKDPDAGKDRRQEEKGATEDKIVGWHHWLNGHVFEQTLGDNEGKRSLVSFSPWGRKESDRTEWLNWTESRVKIFRASKMCLLGTLSQETT